MSITATEVKSARIGRFDGVESSVARARSTSKERVDSARSKVEAKFEATLKAITDVVSRLDVRLGALETLVRANEVTTRRDVAVLTAADGATNQKFDFQIRIIEAKIEARITALQKSLDEKIAALSTRCDILKGGIDSHYHQSAHGSGMYICTDRAVGMSWCPK